MDIYPRKNHRSSSNEVKLVTNKQSRNHNGSLNNSGVENSQNYEIVTTFKGNDGENGLNIESSLARNKNGANSHLPPKISNVRASSVIKNSYLNNNDSRKNSAININVNSNDNSFLATTPDRNKASIVRKQSQSYLNNNPFQEDNTILAENLLNSNINVRENRIEDRYRKVNNSSAFGSEYYTTGKNQSNENVFQPKNLEKSRNGQKNTSANNKNYRGGYSESFTANNIETGQS